MSIALISVYSTDQMMQEYYNIFLYGLLAEREPYQNISHKKMPTFEEHINFVKSKPYKEWFVIYDTEQKKRVGSVYLSKENEIGVFISKNQRKRGFARKAVLQTMEYFYHVKYIKANIAPTNSTSICFFVNMGFKYDGALLVETAEPKEVGDLIYKEEIKQYIYRIINPYYAGSESDLSEQVAAK